MKLGINATGLYPGKVGGAEQYLRNILRMLEQHKDIETYLFLNGDAFPEFEETEQLKTICIDLSYHHDAQLKGYIDLYFIDVWFCPLFHLIPTDCGIPTVTAIFDIQQEYFPENFDKTVLRARRQLTQRTVEHTDLILTISEYSKKTLMEKFGLPEDKIKVTYLDADSSFYAPVDPLELEEEKRKLPEQFILFPANMWPHKNHINLIKGFALAIQKYDLPLQLVFTGAKERESPQIEAAINESGIRSRIEYLGYRPQEEMPYIFRCADMLAFPSLFEGFGIPLVEAMASDLPIICSTSTCVPEIAGDAAVLFDGKKPEEIAEAIRNVYQDQELRRTLVQKGRERRKLFSWESCARETVEYLKSVYVPRKKAAPRLSAHPKVTIVTPSFNQGEFIRETIESVLNQTYDNIEYIVMDGGSTDDTVSILREYNDRIKWASEKDNGQADAVNKGIAVATGEIIGWLNSDDTYYPDAVEKAVNALLSHPEVDMVYGEGDYIDRESNVTGRYNTRMFDYDMLANECFICQPTAFFTKDIAERVGGLNAKLQLCMDYELWMRIGKEGKVLYIPERMATSRMYEDNKTLSRRSEVYKECCREVRRRYRYVPHSWILGYAVHITQRHPRFRLKFVYLLLFLFYNLFRPDYFFQCLKAYLNKQKQKRAQAAAARTPGMQTSDPLTFEQYSDGWISETYKTGMICIGDEDELIITGQNLLPFQEPLVLTVSAGRSRKRFCLRELGGFTLAMRISGIQHGMCRVMIESNQTIVPAELGVSTDRRRLSILLNSMVLRKAKSEKPLVSIITPSYNQAEFIRATIESVLSQNYENLEYLVIDGGSTDGTLDILEEYKGRLRYISEPDGGQSNAINKGFRMARGEIVAWLNSDDVYEPDCVTKAVEALENNPDAVLAYGDGYIIDRDGNKVRPFEFSRSFSLWALTNIWDYIMQPAAFFRKEAVCAVGMLDESLNWCMDWDLWVKLARYGEVTYINDYLACSREYEQTKTSTGSDRRLEEILKLLRRVSGKQEPFGYEIYYCSDLLAHHKLEPERREEVVKRLSELITLQPAPDNEGRCTGIANFMIRPYRCWRALEIEITRDCEIPITFFLNGEEANAGVYEKGKSYWLLPVKAYDADTFIRVEIGSEELSNIGNQKDSWVKMRLVD